MTISIRDVANKAGVSISTVSRILNNNDTNISISEQTKKKVLAVCEDLKFQPNIHAHRFFKKKSETVGLIIPPQSQIKGVKHAFTDYNLGELLSGVENAITKRGYRLTVLVADDDFIDAKKHIHLLRDHSIDGLLLWGLRVNEMYILDLQQESFPYIILNGYVYSVQANSIIADNKAGSFAVTEHLINLKHRKIGYIKGPQDCAVSVDRYAGYQDAIAKYGLTIYDEFIEEGDFTEEDGHWAMKRMLEHEHLPTAVCAANDTMAIGALKAIKEHGLIVPDNIALAGGDGIPLTEYVVPAITTIKTPMYELGLRGVNKLFEIIENNTSEPVQEVLKTELIIRASTAGSCNEKSKL